MRSVLLAPMLVGALGLGLAGILVARQRVQQQADSSLAADLDHSLATYQNFAAQRENQLSREATLLASLPSLKALLTTRDQRTIQDAGTEFWRTSGADVFELTAPDGSLLAEYGLPEGGEGLQQAVKQATPGYALAGRQLFVVVAQPVYFGPPQSGIVLGYVVTGYSVGRALAGEVAQAANADVAFLAEGQLVTSTLDDADATEFARSTVSMQNIPVATKVKLGGANYLVRSAELSPMEGVAGGAQIVVLKSFAQADAFVRAFSRQMAAMMFGAVLLGWLLALWLAARVTRPLEELAESTKALGRGDFEFALPTRGTREVQSLSGDFADMRDRLRDGRQQLLDAERLATIGRMASSVSHDLRHYLAAVYANAEFLFESVESPAERLQLLTEIRQAVDGMTDLLDSLLIFARTGAQLRLASERIEAVAESAVSMAKNHPDAIGVQIALQVGNGAGARFWIDTRKVERALYNLVLNACQATRYAENVRNVLVHVSSAGGIASLRVEDNGSGISDALRPHLFEPFVSEGKESGTGLGLTVAQHIAIEHGGDVTLESEAGAAGKTVFLLTIHSQPAPAVQNALPEEAVSLRAER
jgi:signal transduction histidine kinase